MKRKMISVLGISLLLLLVVMLATAASSVEFGMDSEIWIAARTDGKAGSGMQNDPDDGSTQEKFDYTMNRLHKPEEHHNSFGSRNFLYPWILTQILLIIHRRDGLLTTAGRFSGSGDGNTTPKLAGFTYLDPQQIDVSVTNGIWKTKGYDHVYQVGQEIKLVAGAD